MNRSQSGAARVFSITYLVCFVTIMVVFSRSYAPYLVWEDGAETARRFLTHERAVRTYLTGAFFYGVGLIVLSSALYVVLRPVRRGTAICAAFFKFAYSIFWFISLLGVLATLRQLESAGALRTFGLEGVIAAAGLQFDLGRDAYYVGLVLNGLGSVLFAWLFYRSRYIPRDSWLYGA